MTLTRNLLRLAAGLAALALAGCITLLPETKPTQLYRFAIPVSETVEATPSGVRAVVIRAGGGFHPAAAGDRILTTEGAEAAYLANARWTQAASVLFDQALIGAFAASRGPARLVIAGEPGRPVFGLRVDVSRFEANYDGGPRAAPEIQIDVHVVVTRLKDQKVMQEQTYSIRQRAAENRGAAIASAFQAAVAEAIVTIVKTTDAGVSAAAAG